MSLHDEIAVLQRELQTLVGQADLSLIERYDPRLPLRHERLSLYRRLRRAIGRALRQLGLRHDPPPPPWLPALKHFEGGDSATALVIWGVGADCKTLRLACRGIERLGVERLGFAPVLITDVADFAFYSRLGWLIELVPKLSAPADQYAARKLRYLAWRYRDAPALPLSAGLAEGVSIETLIAATRESTETGTTPVQRVAVS